jgi:hypothetical protein
MSLSPGISGRVRGTPEFRDSLITDREEPENL